MIRPVLAEMHKRGILFQGFLYAGLILTKDGLTLPQFNDEKLSLAYAGVEEQDEKLVSSGGRIMMVISSDKDLKAAQANVNQAIKDNVDSNDYAYRTDIGDKAFR